MKGKVCLITGASSGIGKETAIGLARMGATIVMVGRTKGKAEAAREEVVAKTRSESVELKIADLSSWRAVRDLASEFRKKHDRLHVLINNAGIIPAKRTVTTDGLETQFAVNHLAPFLLTNLLLDMVKASAPARIVMTSSGVHTRGRMDFDDLQAEHGYRYLRAYTQSKLANILFTYELARRLKGKGVTVNCFTPGMTKTDLGRYLTGPAGFIFRSIGKSPENGARSAIYLASSPEVEGVTGKYFANCEATRSSSISYDETVARRLWEVSEKLTGLV